MKRLIYFFLIAFFALTSAQGGTRYYGSAPFDPDTTLVGGYGTGKNNYMEVAIRLSVANDPLVASLKQVGRVVGIRVYLREDYHQRAKGWSYITARKGRLTAEPEKRIVNFDAGWNEVMFDTPIEIGDEELFIGAQVYETKGTPYPFGIFTAASVPFYTNANRAGWNEVREGGCLLLQAIVETDGEEDGFPCAATVSFSSYPQVVKPSAPFPCTLYVHNLMAEPLTSLTFTSGDGASETTSYTIDFEEAIAAFDGRAMSYSLVTGSTEGTAVPLTLKVTTVNGHEATPTAGYTRMLYVMRDAFVRVPLVEEFTSQRCVNCPFMIYFLDRAIDAWREEGKNVLYVTHHSGFAEDAFTQPVDRELLYLFGGPETYNPAVMYDRRVFVGEDVPVHSARVADSAPYSEAIEAVASVAAMAEVNVEATANDDGTMNVHIYGAVNKGYVNEEIPIYLSAYIIEDGISADEYMQQGLDDETAPSDLKETFRHNGVIRQNLCTRASGDPLDITVGEDCTFDLTFGNVYIDDTWKWENCDIVAFVHRIDKVDLTANYVLNAGSMRLTQKTLDIQLPLLQKEQEEVPLFDLWGRKIEPGTMPTSGMYIKKGKKIWIH